MGFLGKLFGGGSSAKTDRKTALTGFGDLQSVFNFGMDQSKSMAKTGTDTTAAGVSALQDPLKYFKTLLSGDRTQTAAAIAPESNAALTRADAAKSEASTMGTARGGGVAGQNQQTDEKTRAELDNYLFGVRPTAAQEVEKIGTTEAGIGLGEVNAALGFGSLAEGAAGEMTRDAIGSRRDSYEMNKDTLSHVTQSIESILGAIF